MKKDIDGLVVLKAIENIGKRFDDARDDFKEISRDLKTEFKTTDGSLTLCWEDVKKNRDKIIAFSEKITELEKIKEKFEQVNIRVIKLFGNGSPGILDNIEKDLEELKLQSDKNKDYITRIGGIVIATGCFVPIIAFLINVLRDI